MLDGPHTNIRRSFLSSCRMSSMSVCVLPVPGGPCIRAISREAIANLTASVARGVSNHAWSLYRMHCLPCCELLRFPVIQSSLPTASSRSAGIGVGEECPNSVRTKSLCSDSDSFCSLRIVSFILGIHVRLSPCFILEHTHTFYT